MSLRFFSVTSAGLWLDHEFSTGATCLLGTADDGVEQVLALASGCVRPERGVVSLDHKPLFNHPDTRAAVGTLSSVEWAPPGSTAFEWVEQLQGLHRVATSSAAAEQCLSDLGLSALGRELMGDLSPDQRRGVALAVALGLHAPKLLALSTPFEVRSVSQRAVVEKLAEHAQRSIVLFSTTQQRDAARLGAQARVFAANRCVGQWAAEQSGPAHRNVCYRVTCDPPAKLCAALLGHPAVLSVQAPAHRSTLEVIGTAPEATSLALLEAADEAGVTIHDLFEAPLDLEALQANMRGHSDGMYQAALQSARVAQERSTMAAAPGTVVDPAPTAGDASAEPVTQEQVRFPAGATDTRDTHLAEGEKS